MESTGYLTSYDFYRAKVLKSSSASIVEASRYYCNFDAILLLDEVLLDPNLILAHVLLLEVERGRGIGDHASPPYSELTPNSLVYSSNNFLNVVIIIFIWVVWMSKEISL